MDLQCEKAVEKIWWFGYNKEKSIEAGKEKIFTGLVGIGSERGMRVL